MPRNQVVNQNISPADDSGSWGRGPAAVDTPSADQPDERSFQAHIAVVGATGAVGREVLSILAERGIPADRVHAWASDRSVGRYVPYGLGELEISAVDAAFVGVSCAVFAADADTSARLAPAARDAGVTVVDNSSAFRLHADVPLIVPEVNGHEVEPLPKGGAGESPLGEQPGPASTLAPFIANPNCSTILLVAAVDPLRRAFGVREIDVVTYQAVSGAGLAAIDELHDQVRAGVTNQPAAPRVFAEPCAFNVFSHDSRVETATGVNGEERKIIAETRKIWRDPALRVTPTCVRVPVVRAHTLAITVTLERGATEGQVGAAFADRPGLRVIDDREKNSFPTPLKASGADDVLVGRIRPDPGASLDSDGRSRRWCLLASGDQLRKGAALNAVQILEHLGVRLGHPRTFVPTVPA